MPKNARIQVKLFRKKADDACKLKNFSRLVEYGAAILTKKNHDKI